MPSNNWIKIGVATAAAAVGAILALTSVFAHSTTTTGTSLVGSIVGHANSLGIPADFTIRNMAIAEQEQDAQEAAELAAKIAAAQQLAAQKAAAAAVTAAADPCVANDQIEDANERAAGLAEDATEKINGEESPADEAAEKAARQAAEKLEAPEVACAGAAASKVKTFASASSAEHHSSDKHHH